MAVNRLLDALPRSRLGRTSREVPTFRTCGIVGYYGALITVLGATVLKGRSLLVMAVVALVCGLSFFAWAYFRKWIVGREQIVLLEHVWFAQVCAAATLWCLAEPVLAYLDVVSVGLCLFLACGRVGCLLVGCCHGQPSSLGIRYDERFVADGFTPHLVGVRLFPVPAVEALGLLVIGSVGLVALALAGEGKAFLWFLVAYSVMRFGLEGVRGDVRPHFLGLSQPRWMCLAELGLALVLADSIRGSTAMSVRDQVLVGVLVLALIASLAGRRMFDLRGKCLMESHVADVRRLVRDGMLADQRRSGSHPPFGHRSSLGVGVAVSRYGAAGPPSFHVSLSAPGPWAHVALLCELAETAIPEAAPDRAQVTGAGVLHLIVPATLEDLPPQPLRPRGRLYGAIARALQTDLEDAPDPEGALALPSSRTMRPAYFSHDPVAAKRSFRS